MRLRVAFIAVLPAILQAQATSFDVASVKSGKPGAPRGQNMETRRFTGNDRLLGYIETAWNLMLASPDEQDAMLAQLPKWASTENFEIQAVTRSNLSKDQMRLALRSLLADRFRLQAHTVTEIVSVLALVLDKPAIPGANLRPHSRGEPCDVHSSSHSVGAFPPLCGDVVAVNTAHGAILMGARDVTIAQIAAYVSLIGGSITTHPIVDQTGLTGNFDFTVEFTPERRASAPPDDFQPTTLLEALHEQLGLKMRSTKSPLDSLIIDHVERPEEN